MVKQVTPDQIASFMQDVIVQCQQVSPAFGRRAEPRESVAIPIRVQQLDDDLRPIGCAKSVVTRDLSCSGIGFFHTERLENGPLRICLTAPYSSATMNLLANIEHCTRVGDFYIVGCRIQAVSPTSAVGCPPTEQSTPPASLDAPWSPGQTD